jgi:hypothetical protein
MVLYFVLLGLNAVWSGLFYRMARPRAAFAAVLAQGLVTLAALVIFWNIWILPGVLLIPVLAWTGFVAIRNLALVAPPQGVSPIRTAGCCSTSGVGGLKIQLTACFANAENCIQH